MNKLVYFLLCIGISFLSFGQKKGINYQAVILDPNPLDIPGNKITGQPFQKGKVAIKFSISSVKGLDYVEIQQTETDEFGLVNLTIGQASANGNLSSNSSSESGAKYSTFDTIVWDELNKKLAVAVSFDNEKTFIEVSNQKLSYSPYSLYADAVEYKNVREAPTKLSQFSNDAGYLIPKDLDPLNADVKNNTSQIAMANQTIAENKKSSEASFLIANQSITSLDAKVAENTKAINQNTSSIGTITTKLTDQQNQIFDNRNQISATNNNLTTQIGGLQGQLSVTNSTVSNLSGATEMVANKSTSTDLGAASPSDQLYPSQKAAKTYIDQSISRVANSGVPDATTLAAGKLQLSGDLGGTATSPTVPALANKENTANKSLNVLTDAGDNTKYPSVKAVKDYVDQATLGTALQATVDAKADKNSPTFTGTPILPTGTTAITQTSTDNSTKLATTAFVQQATAGIALQAAVDAKADKNSPTFTGTPVLPTGTTAITQTAGNNTTSLATTAFVQLATAAGIIDASSTTKGKLKLTGDLGGTADLPSVPGLALKANSADVTSSLALKEDVSNKSTTTALGTSDAFYPSQKAVKTYVDAQIASATIADAEATVKGKLKLTGDLGGTADLPTVPGLLLKAPIASPTFTGTVAGITKAMVGLANVDNTTDAAKPVSTATQTALDAKANATATTDALALKAPLASPTFTGAPALPTGTTAITQTSTDNSTKLATTAFVQQSTAAATPDATTSATGKVQLAGDLTGTAASPTIAANAIITAKIVDANVTYGKIQNVSATDKVLGRVTAGSGTVEEISTTGSGNVVRATSPTMVTPALGVASATTVNKLTLTAPATSATLSLADGSSLVTAGAFSQTLTSTAATNVTLPTTGTLATLAGSETLSNKTLLSAILVTPNLGMPSALEGTNITGTASALNIGGNASTATTSTNLVGGSAGSIPYQTASRTTSMLDASANNGYVLTYDTGTNAPKWAAATGSLSGLTSLNGLSADTQTFAIGTSGNTPAFSSATSTHTLNIPMANKTNVTAGLISKAEYDAFNEKQGTLSAGSGISIASGTISATELTTSNLASSAGITSSQITSALTGKTYNGLTPTAQITGFTIAGGTTSKTLTVLLDANVSGTNTGDQTISLTGDVTGSGTGSFTATIETGAITTTKILDGTIASTDLANASVTDAKITGVAGSKVTGNITGNATNVTGTVAVANGGTGATTLTANNVLLGNGTSALQAVVPGTSGNVLTSNGTTWVSSSNITENSAHSIGELYGGGIVFYIYDGGKHGLIAATNDQSSEIKWDLSSGNETRAKANGIGAGIKNTTIIISSEISQRKSYNFAAGICNEYSKSETENSLETTYGDWYLPSKYELNLLYLKRTIVGNFAAYKYWSSTEYDANKAWTINFNVNSGSAEITSDKTSDNRVRAIRNF